MEIKFSDIYERMKSVAHLRGDSDLARDLEVTPQSVSAFKKQGKFPSDLLIKFCFKHKISLDWLFTGEGEMKRGERPHVAAERVTMYNAGDSELREICEFLKESPVDKKLILKMIKGRKMADEALESLKGKRLVEEG